MDPFQLHFIVISCAHYVVVVPVSFVNVSQSAVFSISFFLALFPSRQMTCETFLLLLLLLEAIIYLAHRRWCGAVLPCKVRIFSFFSSFGKKPKEKEEEDEDDDET